MDCTILLPLLITTLFGLIGWLVVHRLESRRDFEDKKREIVTQYLIGCYNDLCTLQASKEAKGVDFRELQKILNYVQLFGSSKQIAIVNVIIKNLKTSEDCDIAPLINELRNELRKFLLLEHLDFEDQFIDIKILSETKNS